MTEAEEIARGMFERIAPPLRQALSASEDWCWRFVRQILPDEDVSLCNDVAAAFYALCNGAGEQQRNAA